MHWCENYMSYIGAHKIVLVIRLFSMFPPNNYFCINFNIAIAIHRHAHHDNRSRIRKLDKTHNAPTNELDGFEVWTIIIQQKCHYNLCRYIGLNVVAFLYQN